MGIGLLAARTRPHLLRASAIVTGGSALLVVGVDYGPLRDWVEGMRLVSPFADASIGLGVHVIFAAGLAAIVGGFYGPRGHMMRHRHRRSSWRLAREGVWRGEGGRWPSLIQLPREEGL